MAVAKKKRNTEDIAFVNFKKKLQKYLNSYQVKKVEKGKRSSLALWCRR